MWCLSRVGADTARSAHPHSVSSGARVFVPRNISLSAGNASVGGIAVPGNPTSSQTEFYTLLAANASVAQNFCSARDGHHTVGAKRLRCAEVMFMPVYTGSGTADCTILLSSTTRSVTFTTAERCTPHRPVRWHDHVPRDS